MIWLALLIGGAVPLYFWLRPEGRFTPGGFGGLDSSVADHSGVSSSAPVLAVRVLSWNVLQSQDRMLGGPWDLRKESFEMLLGCEDGSSYGVICMQEALPEQIAFFASILPGYEVYAVGRDDGKSAGEHCPIFFDAAKYRLRDSGTFWLSPTPEKPSVGWGENVPRLCSWVELGAKGSDGVMELGSGEEVRFRVYNLHLQLHPWAQPKGARVMAEKLREAGCLGEEKIPCVITGDFNAPHRWPALRVLEGCGFTDAEASGALTYHVRGKGVRCLDHIMIDGHWRVAGGGLVKEKGGTVFPSDHFGLWADLVLHPQGRRTENDPARGGDEGGRL